MWDALHRDWSLNHDITTSIRFRPTPIFQKSTPDLHMHNSVRVDPYAHPQHIKVLKHFAYIWHGCGIPSMGVGSLKHDTWTSYRLSHTPFSLKLPPPAHVLWHKGVPICPSTASQGAKTICKHPTLMWDTVNGGWQLPVKVFSWYKSQYHLVWANTFSIDTTYKSIFAAHYLMFYSLYPNCCHYSCVPLELNCLSVCWRLLWSNTSPWTINSLQQLPP